MKHNYTDDELLEAFEKSEPLKLGVYKGLRAFLSALPVKSAEPDRPQSWPGQQEAIDKAFEQQGNYYLAAHPFHNEWESDAPDRLSIAQAYDAARPQAVEIAELKSQIDHLEERDRQGRDELVQLRTELREARKSEDHWHSEAELLRAEEAKAQAELAALRQPILSDDGQSLGQVLYEAGAAVANNTPGQPPCDPWSESEDCHEAAEAAAQAVVAAARPAIEAECLAQAVRRMEAVTAVEVADIIRKTWLERGAWIDPAAEAIRTRLIAAARGEGQAKPSTRIEITEIPDKKPGPVGTLAYAPQAEALPSTQQNKSESSALEKQAVQEAAYILNHYDRKSHADHICLGKKLIREGWKGPNFGKQKSDLKLTLHRSAAEDTPQAEAKDEPAKLLGQHGPKGAPALCGPSANPVVVNEPPKSEGQPDLSGESEKQDLGAMVKAAREAAIKGLTGPAWIPHDGGPCPLKDEEVEEFEFKIRDGKVSGNVFVPSGWRWSNDGTTGDIIAYRVLRWKPGFGPEAKAEPAQPWTPENAKAYEDFQAELRETWEAKPWTPAVGDTVRLKSGGPVMTVTAINTNGLCAVTEAVGQWFARKTVMGKSFPAACLTPVQNP